MAAFDRFRPTSHFIAPHSWLNDPCGAVYVPETSEYLLCYQWNPGTTGEGNSAWGMARSKDLVIWRDSSPAIENGVTTSYDCLGVFSGSIVSRLVGENRVLYLFYTSVSSLPIHWSKEYIEGCESQSVAVSTDLGISWNRYEHNPLLKTPPHRTATRGWRDPCVSRWQSLSLLIGQDMSTEYMMISSSIPGRSQLHLYKSNNLLDWEFVITILDVESGSMISPTSTMRFGMNFECAGYFSIGERDYIVVGVEEDDASKRHRQRYTLWLGGGVILEDGIPKFNISNHGLLDHGILYAPHVFRDSHDCLIQLGWADEAVVNHMVRDQGWSGCLTQPRELFEISKPVSEVLKGDDIWSVDEVTGMATTLGIRPAAQLSGLREREPSRSLSNLREFRGTNAELEATFTQLLGEEKFVFNFRECPESIEVTSVILNLGQGCITVDRSKSSVESLGTDLPDSGRFNLVHGEDLTIRIVLDNSILEVYANDRFAATSRVYPTLEDSIGASYDFGSFDERNVEFKFWGPLKNAWPER